ncbi:MAG TPA: sigma-70 family RNA polymerase sigma factor [Burkholderiales bacterium]|nr:sigma-70 family RNA polymerase sigma factor [Burkholderiales bacterium]
MAAAQEKLDADQARERAPKTLGDVLYAGRSGAPAAEQEWFGLVRAIAAGDQVALHALYERSHRLVFTLLMRITGRRKMAEELTLEVFHDVWRRAYRYDPGEGTVVGRLMNQARSRALARLRAGQRKKNDEAEFADERRALCAALDTLAPEERQTIEGAFFSELTHAEIALRRKESLETVGTRIGSGLHKLRQALAEGRGKP